MLRDIQSRGSVLGENYDPKWVSFGRSSTDSNDCKKFITAIGGRTEEFTTIVLYRRKIAVVLNSTYREYSIPAFIEFTVKLATDFLSSEFPGEFPKNTT